MKRGMLKLKITALFLGIIAAAIVTGCGDKNTVTNTYPPNDSTDIIDNNTNIHPDSSQTPPGGNDSTDVGSNGGDPADSSRTPPGDKDSTDIGNNGGDPADSSRTPPGGNDSTGVGGDGGDPADSSRTPPGGKDSTGIGSNGGDPADSSQTPPDLKDSHAVTIEKLGNGVVSYTANGVGNAQNLTVSDGDTVRFVFSADGYNVDQIIDSVEVKIGSADGKKYYFPVASAFLTERITADAAVKIWTRERPLHTVTVEKIGSGDVNYAIGGMGGVNHQVLQVRDGNTVDFTFTRAEAAYDAIDSIKVKIGEGAEVRFFSYQLVFSTAPITADAAVKIYTRKAVSASVLLPFSNGRLPDTVWGAQANSILRYDTGIYGQFGGGLATTPRSGYHAVIVVDMNKGVSGTLETTKYETECRGYIPTSGAPIRPDECLWVIGDEQKRLDTFNISLKEGLNFIYLPLSMGEENIYYMGTFYREAKLTLTDVDGQTAVKYVEWDIVSKQHSGFAYDDEGHVSGYETYTYVEYESGMNFDVEEVRDQVGRLLNNLSNGKVVNYVYFNK
jgi:hypothetical protein